MLFYVQHGAHERKHVYSKQRPRKFTLVYIHVKVLFEYLYIPHAFRADVGAAPLEAQLGTVFQKRRCATDRRVGQDAARLRGGLHTHSWILILIW